MVKSGDFISAVEK